MFNGYELLVVGNKVDLLNGDQQTGQCDEIDAIVSEIIEGCDDQESEVETLKISAKSGENFDKFADLLYTIGKRINEAKHRHISDVEHYEQLYSTPSNECCLLM